MFGNKPSLTERVRQLEGICDAQLRAIEAQAFHITGLEARLATLEHDTSDMVGVISAIREAVGEEPAPTPPYESLGQEPPPGQPLSVEQAAQMQRSNPFSDAPPPADAPSATPATVDAE